MQKKKIQFIFGYLFSLIKEIIKGRIDLICENPQQN